MFSVKKEKEKQVLTDKTIIRSSKSHFSFQALKSPFAMMSTKNVWIVPNTV